MFFRLKSLAKVRLGMQYRRLRAALVRVESRRFARAWYTAVMASEHPKSMRRRLLQACYDYYLQYPLDSLSPEELRDAAVVGRDALEPNVFYLRDRGLLHIGVIHTPPYFSAARITAEGIDLVEDAFAFGHQFPPSPDEVEDVLEEVPLLMERLLAEADYSSLGGELRQSLQRDLQFVRGELSRPAQRWRHEVIREVFGWVRGYSDTIDEELPSLRRILEILATRLEA